MQLDSSHVSRSCSACSRGKTNVSTQRIRKDAAHDRAPVFAWFGKDDTSWLAWWNSTVDCDVSKVDRLVPESQFDRQSHPFTFFVYIKTLGLSVTIGQVQHPASSLFFLATRTSHADQANLRSHRHAVRKAIRMMSCL
jgi:hypothetical protein